MYSRMTPSRVHEGSLRLDQPEFSRLAWAFGISLAIHLACFGTYELGKKFNFLQALHLPAWLQKIVLASAPKEPRNLPQEAPLIFVDVDPTRSTAEAPKNAKFYSNRNSQAANADADRDLDIPKITGTQREIAKADDVQRSKFDKLQPVFAPRDSTAEQPKPKSPAPPGDLVMAKPDPNLRPDNGSADDARPRTIKEALMRQHRSVLVGEKMKQEGGVLRNLGTSFDVKGTPFGSYDAAFIEVVQSRWYDLLDNMSYDGYRRGKVVVQFHLNYNGYITDMKVLEENVGTALSLMCQKAVSDPSPFDKWPREMRLMVDKDYREIQFTFYYN